MVCPKCKTEYNCPCDSCKKNFPKLKQTFVRFDICDDNWKEMCLKCGFTRDAHWWFDEEGRQYELKKKSGNYGN